MEKYADPKNAAMASAEALFAKYPDESHLCGLGEDMKRRSWEQAAALLVSKHGLRAGDHSILKPHK